LQHLCEWDKGCGSIGCEFFYIDGFGTEARAVPLGKLMGEHRGSVK
jgi:hypothetical protein